MLYNVHTMKGFKVAEARERFGEMLDQAERGETVYIVRRGVRFLVEVEPRQSKAARAPVFAHVDEDVLSGQWTWDLTSRGLRFRPRRKRR